MNDLFVQKVRGYMEAPVYEKVPEEAKIWEEKYRADLIAAVAANDQKAIDEAKAVFQNFLERKGYTAGADKLVETEEQCVREAIPSIHAAAHNWKQPNPKGMFADFID